MKKEFVKRDGTRYWAEPEAEHLRMFANRLAKIMSDANSGSYRQGLEHIPTRLQPLIDELRANANEIDKEK